MNNKHFSETLFQEFLLTLIKEKIPYFTYKLHSKCISVLQ